MTKRSAMGHAMAIPPAKGHAMGHAMGAVPCSIERYTAPCYGILTGGRAWAMTHSIL